MNSSPASSDPVPPSQGLVAGKYQLVRMIGRGGMGSVWEARHISLGTPSAIKFIEAEYADSQEARSRFDKEAKAAATIQSKHAIQIYDHGMTDDGKPYIVMELLQGEPLDKVIERGPLSLQDTAKILQQVGRGLARAHERGIIHRDLKPENIFLVKTPDDDEAVAKVLDFGIAKMSNGPNGSSGGLTSSTKTGAVLGTPFYMSPEQARGLRNVDHRADIWSLGVIAFKCITGKLPFDGESVGDLLVKICTAPVPVPSQIAMSLGIPGIPTNFDAWFMRALEREPERRFATVTELSDGLCFAAGLQTRSAGGGNAPLSHLATVGAPGAGVVAPGMITPNHMGGPGGVPSGNAYTPNSHQPHLPTPAPGAMTNSPFTREEISAVPGGKGKLVIGGILAGLLAVAAVVGVVIFLKKGTMAQPDPTNGVGISPPAASSTQPVADNKPADNKPADSPPAADTNTAAAANNPPPNNTQGATTPPTPPKKGATRPPTPPTPPTNKTASTTPPLPPPTTPAAPASTPAKKPNKNDPGY
jgi:eukaryotic-like serine/threonine-protein kinase